MPPRLKMNRNNKQQMDVIQQVSGRATGSRSHLRSGFLRCFLLLLAVGCCSICSFGQAHANLDGKWINEDKSTIIEFYEKNNSVFGKIVWLRDSVDQNGEAHRDIFNSEARLRSRKLIGITMISDMMGKKSGTKWTGGSIYHYQSGNTYNALMYLEDGYLWVKGYWWWFRILGKTKRWEKI
jgi:uncharacterized protein (DUF2147 family)